MVVTGRYALELEAMGANFARIWYESCSWLTDKS